MSETKPSDAFVVFNHTKRRARPDEEHLDQTTDQRLAEVYGEGQGTPAPKPKRRVPKTVVTGFRVLEQDKEFIDDLKAETPGATHALIVNQLVQAYKKQHGLD